MNNASEQKQVLVTGGTGFVGVHCILQLLNNGHRVKTTLRTMKRQDEVLDMLRNGGAQGLERLSFIEADLSQDKNWQEATEGCAYVLHVASPIGLNVPNDESEMIRPAVDGTLRVLRAAKQSGVRRVVLTSSFAAVGYSHNDPNTLITEECWTDPNEKHLAAYLKSKTLAERAAWDFMQKEGGDLELAVVNPTAIFGPTLGRDLSSAFELLKQLMDGTLKAVPQISFGVVDVRDVADLHLRAMTNPQAKGQRFLAISGEPITFPAMAKFIREKFGSAANKVSTKVLPNFVVRIAALFSPAAKTIAPQLGRSKRASNAKAKQLLGWAPRSNEEAIAASVESMLKFGVVPRT